MRATARKIRIPNELKSVGHYYAVVVDGGRPVWMCEHSHETRRDANRCARGGLRNIVKRGPAAALRRLRRSWTPNAAEVPRAADGRPELRRSWVESFLMCVQHVDEETPDGTWGTVVHDAIHAYWQLCLARGEESMLSAIPRLVAEAFFRWNVPDPNRLQEAVDVVESFASSRLLAAHELLVVDRRPAIEFTLRADVGWAWLIGRVDRIDRKDAGDPDDAPTVVRIRDYKTGWAGSGGRALDGVTETPQNGHTPRVVPHEFQRRFYAQLAFLDPALGGELEEVQTEIDYIRYRGEPEVISYYRGELDMWWQMVLHGLELRWARRSGPPTGCAGCETCALRSTCAAVLTAAKSVPRDETEAMELAERWLRTEAMASTQHDALKKYAQKGQVLHVGGKEIGFLRPRDPRWKPRRDATLDIVKHLDLAGLPGAAATYPMGIAADKIPSNMKAPLVDAGLASWEYGEPEFKSRKTGEK